MILDEGEYVVEGEVLDRGSSRPSRRCARAAAHSFESRSGFPLDPPIRGVPPTRSRSGQLSTIRPASSGTVLA